MRRGKKKLIFGDLNECSEYGCGGKEYGVICAQSEINKRLCICPAGLTGTALVEGHQAFAGCTDVDECLTEVRASSTAASNLCPKNAECKNTFGGYTCSCMSGFSQVNSTDNTKEIQCGTQPTKFGKKLELELEFQLFISSFQLTV